MIEERFFYHSFPRRGHHTTEAALTILEAIRDIGLALLPEYIEWRQPTSEGTARLFPILQTRVCFTELSPAELPQHAKKFGTFALEFEADAVRRLGAIPVFYLPQPVSPDGNALGIALLGIAMDAKVVINRIAELDKILHGALPVAEDLNLTFPFASETRPPLTYTCKSAEAAKLIDAFGSQTTPWSHLDQGIKALLNFFYPADDIRHDKALEYYRQREWRIACQFAINGAMVNLGGTRE
jgi:hypothetical protein